MHRVYLVLPKSCVVIVVKSEAPYYRKREVLRSLAILGLAGPLSISVFVIDVVKAMR